MRTNIEIDDRLMEEALKLTGLRTKREAVDLALRELVARHRQLGVLKLRGRVHWVGDLAATREGRVLSKRVEESRGSRGVRGRGKHRAQP
jgi:Arc/MetJ family transcription regulator